MADKIRAEERLMNLTVALLSTEVGLTREQIFGTVTGYVEQVRSGRDEPALERMFERDKELLSSLGTRIEVIGDSENPQNLREARYRIPREDNELPDDLEFTPAELAALSLAAEAWAEATMSREARAGVRKIRALGLDVDEPILGFAPQLSVRDTAFAPLQEAIERGVEVRFEYARAGSQRVRARRVRPLALVQFEARWHLYGYDVGLDEPRTFLLSRITSDVVRTSTAFDRALIEGAADRALEGLRGVVARQSARLAVIPGSEAALRLGRRSGSGSDAQQLDVPYADALVFADELASYGPEVRVVSPPELAELVVERLAAVRRLHSRPADTARADAATPLRAPRKIPVVSADRVRTYLTLVPWLLERGDVPVSDIAAAFELPEDEVRRLLSTLTVVGAPGLDAYTGDMFDIDWDLLEQHDIVRLTHTVGIDRVQRFTAREAAALAAGVQLLQAVPGVADADALESLRSKLSRGSTTPASMAVAVDAPVDGVRADLARAIRERLTVRFTYRRPDGDDLGRTVDPMRLLVANGEWYLQGWCHLRRATRTFHLERMSDLDVTATAAEHGETELPGLFEPGADDVVATLRFPTRLRGLVADYLEHATLRVRGDDTYAFVPVADPAALRRLAGRGGGSVEVVAPQIARDAARNWAEAGENLNSSALD